MRKLIFALTMVSALSFTACDKTEDVVLDKEPLTTSIAGLPETAARKSYALNTETSVIEWWGAGPAASHHGSFSVIGQDIEVVNGKVKEGKFVIPIASIQNFDLPDEIKPVLLDHLKSPDFFNMLLYPEAVFDFKKVTPLKKAEAGSVAGANYLVNGNFTMLGKELPVSFPANIVVGEDQLSVEATFKINRTLWGMNYGADPALGDHHIYPEVELHLKLKGQKQ